MSSEENISVEKLGASDIYVIEPVRSYSEYKGRARVSEKFYESHDPKFDANFILGVSLRHSVSASGGINGINSLPYRGYSKKARAITRLFIRKVYMSMGQSESVDNVYTENQSWVGTSDHGENSMPDLSAEGTLGFNWNRTYYKQVSEIDLSVIQLTHMQLSPNSYEYDWREVTFPIFFYVRSYEWVTQTKPNHALFLLEMAVRFFASDKSSKVARE